MNGQNVPVVAVDGPSGTGKGTLCCGLAARLGWHLLDSGAVYRALAWCMEQRGISGTDEGAVVELADAFELEFIAPTNSHRDVARVLVDGQDVSLAVRSEACGDLASRIAALPRVRVALLERQHQFRLAPGLVADGRDMGTVVFPDAAVKVFLTASTEERANRRYKQLKEKGIGVSLAQLLEDIRARDKRDRERPVSPLMPAADAVVVDTTELTSDQVLERVLKIISEKLPWVSC
jgi:cytidylate kinase